jgi:hypothetical protein
MHCMCVVKCVYVCMSLTAQQYSNPSNTLPRMLEVHIGYK